MELPNSKEIAPSASGYPIKDYALKPHEMSSPEYHTIHITLAVPLDASRKTRRSAERRRTKMVNCRIKRR